ncbi:MAG: hypothetical protein AAFX06_24995 [Planctomycetota bacterium]
MKAFGVRLAAGAATILVGFFMATQSQKSLQTEAESAWTEDSIPPASRPEPVGRGRLVSSDTWPDELKPFSNPFAKSDTSEKPESAIALVGHTEPSDGSATTSAMLLPTTDSTTESAPASTARLILPGTGGAEPAPATTPAFPSTPTLKMGAPTFAAEMPPASQTPPAEPPAEPTSVAAFPSNGLRGSATSLRGDASGQALSNTPPPANESPINAVTQLLMQVPQDDASTQNGSAGNVTTEASSTLMPAENAITPSMSLRSIQGVPGSELITPESTPVLPAPSNPSIVGGNFSSPAGNGYTLSMPGSPDPQTAPPSGMALPTESPFGSAPAMPAMNGLAGDYPQPPAGGAMQPTGATQPVGGFGDNGGYNHPAGGFSSVPANYGGVARPTQPAQLPPAGMTNGQSQGLSQPPQSFGAPPLSPGAIPSPITPEARTASLPRGNNLYQNQPAGYRDRSLERPLPAGPTMAAPGDRRLDGPQSPSVVIHKRAPAEVKVGKQATFVITVKNVGGATAMDVQVRDRIPTGMRLDDASPRPDPKYQPELVWDLGSLEPQQERTITLQLTPLQEGELGSVARVTFQAAASVRTISTRPELKIVQKANPQALIGQLVEIELEISNPGTGEATGVVLQEDVPVGLEHPQGRELDNFIGNLGPGEVRRQILRMKAVQAGTVENTIRVKADDGLETYHSIPIQIIAPELQIALTGPSKRYLERQAKFELQIANTGTANAENIDISVQLDRGFTFVSTDYEGQYDASRHAVFWSLPALPVGESGRVPLVLLPVEEGNRVLRAEASADLGVKASSESQVLVDSLAELTFSINDSADPVEIGGETTYEIRVSNSGSRDDTNVRVHLQLPPGMRLIGNGDFQTDNKGLVVFTPRAMLKANDEIVYRVKAQGVAQGRHLVKAIVTSDQSQVPVTKEESIMVYADQ